MLRRVITLLMIFILLPLASGFEYTATTKYPDLGLCSCATYQNDITVYNLDARAAEFLTQNPGTPDWVSTIDDRIVLQPQTKGRVRNLIEVPCDAKGKFTLKNRVYAATDSVELTQSMQVKKCPNTQVVFNENEAASCACVRSTYSIDLENIGLFEETYVLNSSTTDANVQFTQDEVTLKAGESKRISFTVQFPCEVSGQQVVNLQFYATQNDVLSSLPFPITVNNCDHISLNVKDASPLCSATPSTLEVELQNTGDDSVQLDIIPNADWVSEEKEILLEGKEKVTLNLAIQGQNREGDIPITLDVLNGAQVVASRTVNLDMATCHKLSWQLEPLEVCPSELRTLSLPITNLGNEKVDVVVTKSENNLDWVSLASNSLSLGAEEAGSVVVRLAPEGVETGYYGTLLQAKSSQGFTEERKLDVYVRPDEECTPLRMYPALELETGYGYKQVPLILENREDRPHTYSLSLEASTWITLSNNRVQVPANEQGVTYLEFSPGPEVPATAYQFYVTAKSDDDTHFTKTFIVDVNAPMSFTWIWAALFALLALVLGVFLYKKRERFVMIELIEDEEHHLKHPYLTWGAMLVSTVVLVLGAIMAYKRSAVAQGDVVSTYVIYYLLFVVVVIFVLMSVVIWLERDKREEKPKTFSWAPKGEREESLFSNLEVDDLDADWKKDVDTDPVETSSDIVSNFDKFEKKEAKKKERKKKAHAKKQKPYKAKKEKSKSSKKKK